VIGRILVGVLALVLAVVGGVLAYVYAAGADARAMARLSPVQVLVVAQPIPAGTPAEAISGSLTVEDVPAAAVVPGALTDLAGLQGLVANADLQPGEQLLAARFGAPDALPGGIEIPPGMHQLTIQLEPRRVIGGELSVGDLAGVFVSRGASSETHLIVHKVLVVDVVGGVGVTTNEQGQDVETAPAETVMVTLALTPADAELVVYAAEYERIWLSIEAPDATDDGTRVVTPEVILQ
jgi:pilus assembly protein CpaB